MKRNITFKKNMYLNNSDMRVCVFAGGLPYTVSDLRVDLKMNWIHFSFDNELFEFVPKDDVVIELA